MLLNPPCFCAPRHAAQVAQRCVAVSCNSTVPFRLCSVLLKGYDERGFVWYTNYDSAKVGFNPMDLHCSDLAACRGHVGS